jgi:hypothetical protein
MSDGDRLNPKIESELVLKRLTNKVEEELATAIQSRKDARKNFLEDEEYYDGRASAFRKVLHIIEDIATDLTKKEETK